MRTTAIAAMLALGASLVLTNGLVSADTIVLKGKDGAQGRILSGTAKPTDDGRIEITTDAGEVVVVNDSEIVAIRRDERGIARQNERRAKAAEAAKPAEAKSGDAKPAEGAAMPAGSGDKPAAADAPARAETAQPPKPGDEPSTAKPAPMVDAQPANPDGTRPERQPAAELPVGAKAGPVAGTWIKPVAGGTAGLWPMVRGHTWVRSDGVKETTHKVQSVTLQDGKTVAEIAITEPGSEVPKITTITVSTTDGVTTYVGATAGQPSRLLLVEPMAVGTEWMDELGQLWRVTGTGVDYKDMGGNQRKGCIRIDRIHPATGAAVDGSQWYICPGVGPLTMLKSFSSGN